MPHLFNFPSPVPTQSSMLLNGRKKCHLTGEIGPNDPVEIERYQISLTHSLPIINNALCVCVFPCEITNTTHTHKHTFRRTVSLRLLFGTRKSVGGWGTRGYIYRVERGERDIERGKVAFVYLEWCNISIGRRRIVGQQGEKQSRREGGRGCFQFRGLWEGVSGGSGRDKHHQKGREGAIKF